MSTEKLYMMGEANVPLSKPMSYRETRDWLKLRLDHNDRFFRIKRKGSVFGHAREGHSAYLRAREIMYTLAVGETLLIENVRSGLVYVVRVVEVAVKPANTPGTPGIDIIYAATFDEFDQKFGLVNLGICASKPGEHHECNAWDCGVHKPRSADDIHSAIVEIANWQKQNVGDGLDLPVNGIIVMTQYCEYDPNTRKMTVWKTYHGIAHVSHLHTSARPNLVPGWI